MQSVRQQYERFPYPPINALALPRRDQGKALQYERAVELARDKHLPKIMPDNHLGIRILVAGCGTLEALVVAQMHPRAKEIVALDLSHRSITRLQRRIHWARSRDMLSLARLRGYRLPAVTTIEADVCEWQDSDGFDYILANNMLHHTEQPAVTLQHLVGMLKPDGVMRIVTYPAMSRFWLRQTSAWLRWHGLNADTPALKKRAVEVIEELPQPHPILSCFEAHSETANTAGLVDAFFHACEKPLSPLLWQQATEAAGLEWLGETQSQYSRAEFLPELMPVTSALPAWQQLQVLDDVLELTSNPVWWFCKRGDVKQVATNNKTIQSEEASAPDSSEFISEITSQQHKEWFLPSEVYWQLGQSLRQADCLLQQVSCCVEDLIETLRHEVGPRVARGGWELLGLTMGEYPTTELLQTQQPILKKSWQQLQAKLGESARIQYQQQSVPGNNLAQQIEWLQLYHGPLDCQIGPLVISK